MSFESIADNRVELNCVFSEKALALSSTERAEWQARQVVVALSLQGAEYYEYSDFGQHITKL